MTLDGFLCRLSANTAELAAAFRSARLPDRVRKQTDTLTRSGNVTRVPYNFRRPPYHDKNAVGLLPHDQSTSSQHFATVQLAFHLFLNASQITGRPFARRCLFSNFLEVSSEDFSGTARSGDRSGFYLPWKDSGEFPRNVEVFFSVGDVVSVNLQFRYRGNRCKEGW